MTDPTQEEQPEIEASYAEIIKANCAAAAAMFEQHKGR
jgi:hypothetical protein